jgi:hypothetical protein
MRPLGESFAPTSAADEETKNLSPAQQAIQVLSMRIPRVRGARSISPLVGESRSAAASQVGGFSPESAILQTLMQTLGAGSMPPGSMPGGMPGEMMGGLPGGMVPGGPPPTPNIIPGVIVPPKPPAGVVVNPGSAETPGPSGSVHTGGLAKTDEGQGTLSDAFVEGRRRRGGVF